jgi:DNA-binding PadR family transcriptional regulator
VTDRPDGNRRLYQLNPAGFASLRDYFDQLRSEALEAFKKRVERVEDESWRAW